MLLTRLSSIFIFVYLVSATWTFSEPKICGERRRTMLPFTGFKISRQYKLNGIVPHSMHFVTMTHCDHGKSDYAKSLRTNSSDFIDWNRPFCLLKPGSQSVKKSQDTLLGPVVRNKTLEKEILKDESQKSQKPYWRDKMNSIRKKVDKAIKGELDKGLEKSTEGRFLEYTGKETASYLDEIAQAGPRVSMEWEAANLVCYKMARRKKYARRDISFYMPQTFVGGLFECPIPSTKKKEIFLKFKTSDFLKTFDFSCDSSIAKPLLPLIAEDSTKQWFHTPFLTLSPSVIQTIPYLSTVTPLNLRFAASDTPDMFMNTWASDIHVNEEYNYSELDLHLISRAVALSADYLNKFLKPVNMERIISSSFRTSRLHALESPLLTENDYFRNKLSNLTLDQKTNLFLSLTSNDRQALIHLDKLQEIWDTLIG
ncbi:uncharacterized protein PRCAT00000302001 [Priceomyces carsonii]|uniref:uncharacterized protein n=1 Tax=Priceomyces carsonii TaxID=28549 RepID=UPI002EDA99C5|nr:unnamed protein product [Priceomyces carsonii]